MGAGPSARPVPPCRRKGVRREERQRPPERKAPQGYRRSGSPSHSRVGRSLQRAGFENWMKGLARNSGPKSSMDRSQEIDRRVCFIYETTSSRAEHVFVGRRVLSAKTGPTLQRAGPWRWIEGFRPRCHGTLCRCDVPSTGLHSPPASIRAIVATVRSGWSRTCRQVKRSTR